MGHYEGLKAFKREIINQYPIYNKSGMRERNVLFNNTLNTFYLRLYGVTHMVKDHSDSEKGNPLPPHRQGFFYMHRQDNTYHGLCYTSRGALAGTRCQTTCNKKYSVMATKDHTHTIFFF